HQTAESDMENEHVHTKGSKSDDEHTDSGSSTAEEIETNIHTEEERDHKDSEEIYKVFSFVYAKERVIDSNEENAQDSLTHKISDNNVTGGEDINGVTTNVRTEEQHSRSEQQVSKSNEVIERNVVKLVNEALDHSLDNLFLGDINEDEIWNDETMENKEISSKEINDKRDDDKHMNDTKETDNGIEYHNVESIHEDSDLSSDRYDSGMSHEDSEDVDYDLR
ncbi:Hypothetical predicted protein, partial [Olea europaea subsp. europaea]